jgi:hypothetical protein
MFLTALALVVILQQPSGVDVLSTHNDAGRTGVNQAESTLTPARVKPESFDVAQLLGHKSARLVEEVYGHALTLAAHRKELTYEGSRRHPVHAQTAK